MKSNPKSDLKQVPPVSFGGSAPFGPDATRWIETLPGASLRDGVPTVSPPTKNPAKVYPELPGLTSPLFQIPASGLTAEQQAAALEEMRRFHTSQQQSFLGYQANQEAFPHLEGLEGYLKLQLNNLGDPFTEGNFTLNSKWLERSVLDYYASLWNARWPHEPKDPESYWGYVLSMGSTEGNLYGLWNAREYLSGGALMEDPDGEADARERSMDGVPRKVQQRLVYTRAVPLQHPNMYKPVIFFSGDTHYSIQKAVRALRITPFGELGRRLYPNENPLALGKPWPKEVPSLGGDGGPGSIDIGSLTVLVEFFAARGHPILVFFNYGTTFKGAYDDVEAAGEALMPILQQYGLLEREVVVESSALSRPEKRSGFWFHVDAALGAAYMPFLEMAYNTGRIPHRGPCFDFRLPYVNSIVMSGHKWIGAPWPCGIYMTKTKFQMKPPEVPEYVGTPDTTFAGSRNGFSALLLWSYAARNSYQAQIERALSTEQMAVYAYDRLRELEDLRQEDLWVARTTPCSLTIRFKAARQDIQRRFSLSGETLYVRGAKRCYSHIFIMPHVTHTMIDSLVTALSERKAIPYQVEGPSEVTAGLPELGERLREVLGDGVWIDSETFSIRFRPPSPEISARYHLEMDTFYVNGQKRTFARIDGHNVSALGAIEELLRDLREASAYFTEVEAALPLDEETERSLRFSHTHLAHLGRGFK